MSTTPMEPGIDAPAVRLRPKEPKKSMEAKAMLWVALLVLGAGFGFTIAQQQRTLATIERSQLANQQSLGILRKVTGPAQTKASAIALKDIEICVRNWIDFDTGHAKTILPGCNI